MIKIEMNIDLAGLDINEVKEWLEKNRKKGNIGSDEDYLIWQSVLGHLMAINLAEKQGLRVKTAFVGKEIVYEQD